MYGLREEQFKRLVDMALKSREPTGLALLKLLKRWLDNIVYRLNLTRTRLQGRQFVTHEHIQVDGESINIPSYIVKPGQEILMKESALQAPDVQELAETKLPPPGWLEKRWRRSGREPNREDGPGYSGAADRRVLLTSSNVNPSPDVGSKFPSFNRGISMPSIKRDMIL